MKSNKLKSELLNETAIPLAYFITFTCYGTWLHGGKEISVDRAHNLFGTAFLPRLNVRHESEKSRMSEAPYVLDVAQRQIVLVAIKEVCVYRKWSLMAAHIRTNHVHVVVHASVLPEKILNTLKAYASRHLNKSNLECDRTKRWTRHGSTRYLWKPENVEAAIQYVIYEQGEPMAVFENKTRSLEPSEPRALASVDGS